MCIRQTISSFSVCALSNSSAATQTTVHSQNTVQYKGLVLRVASMAVAKFCVVKKAVRIVDTLRNLVPVSWLPDFDFTNKWLSFLPVKHRFVLLHFSVHCFNPVQLRVSLSLSHSLSHSHSHSLSFSLSSVPCLFHNSDSVNSFCFTTYFESFFFIRVNRE